MNIRKIIGNNIRRKRKELGLSQETLAYRCDLNSDYVAKCERGIMNMTAENIAKIAKGLKVDPYILLVPEGHKTEKT